jgi:putative ABC transport system permease protein
VIPNLITFAQKKLSWYWKKTNVIGTTHLLRSWNKYSFLFVVITIIYTASFCTLGTLASSQALNKQFQFDYPLAVGYIAKDKNKIHERHLLQIHHELKKRKIHYTTYQAKIKFVSLRSSKEKVPRPIPILSYTDYQNMVMQSKQKLIVHPLKANEAMALLTSQLDSYPIQETYESKNTTIKLVQKTVSSNVTIPWRLLQSQPLVVSDTMFASMPSHSIATFTGFYSKDALTKTIGLGKTLVHEGRIMPSDQKPYSMIVSGTLYQNQIYLLRSLFFIMFLVGLVTFIASGSFIYFQLQSDIKTEADRYNILQKIGLTNEKWNKTVCWRLAVLFFLPITVAAIHSVFAMVVLQKYFLVSIVSQWLTVIAAFILGQTLYFLLIYTRYIQDVKNYS